MLIRRVSFMLLTQLFCVSYARNRSLTFVIDDTLSMQNDIDQVLQATYKIFDIVSNKKASEVGNYVLVTFNDPDELLRNHTTSTKTFLRALGDTVVHNRKNYDCPENALSGIIKALKVSSQESFLYVFTDASAKDHNKLIAVKMLCERKQSRVLIILTGDCVGYVGEELGSMSVYYEIARACNGLVIEGNKYDVKDLVDAIVPDVISDQKSVITSKVIPASTRFVPVEFTVDDKTEYVTIQTSGRNVELALKNNYDNAEAVEKLLWKSNFKMVKFNPPKAGKYYAWLRGSTEVTIIIYAATDFTFDHGFSEFQPKSLTDASKLPIANRPHHLSISVTDPEHTVSIKSAEILDMNERVLGYMPLKKARGDFYITEKFMSPQHMFKVQVTGIVKETGREIKRISKTAIEPQMPPPPASKALVATITDGSSVDVDYDGNIQLTCKVSGYPTPRIWWTSADDVTLSKKSNVVELPYDYISYLKLSNIRNRGTYYCKAHNYESLEYSQVEVNPRSPFRVQTPPPDSIKAKYGMKTQIRCDISSSHPFDIKWKTPLRPIDYTLSADKKVLTIKSVGLSAQGRYACEASLKHDPQQKYVINTKLVISDLSSPTIDPETEKITVLYGGKAHIKCKVSGGIPRPTVSWTVMKSTDTQYRELPGSDEEITVDSATLADAGTYHCTARNSEGYASKTTELIVQMKPTMLIEEGSNLAVSYGNNLKITCKVIAIPVPKHIEWRNSKGQILTSKITVNNYEITSRLSIPRVQVSDSFTCYAQNNLGTSTRGINVKMTSPFIIRNQPKDITSAKFGSKTNITCDVRSDFPMRVRWFFKSSAGVSDVLTSGNHKISAAGTTLTILNTNMDAVGTYSCEASLVNDDEQKVAFTTNVQIDNLTLPVLLNTLPKVITVKHNQNVRIPCTIVAGVPPPDVSWHVMKKGNTSFTKLPTSGQELVIDGVALADAGVYQCTAINVKGRANQKIELIVQSQPELVIEEGSKISTNYGSLVHMTCKIIAFPLPSIGWKNSKGIRLPSEDVISNYKVTSRLAISQIKTSDTYTCFAENAIGKSAKSIDVKMMTPLVVRTLPKGITSAKFGSKTNIICDVSSDFPMRVRWFFKSSAGVSEVLTSGNHKISAAGTTLTILNTNMDAVGTYSCEASLVNDDKQKVAFTTNVLIDNLTLPVLLNTLPKVMTVKRNQNVRIPCTIVAGVPPPDVSWHVMKKGDTSFTKLPASGQELVIDGVALADAGVYQCTAINVKGRANQKIELIVQSQPELVIEEGSKISTAYGSVVHMTCKIIAFPLPSIGWKNSKGVRLPSEDVVSNYKVTSRLSISQVKTSDTYTCFAENAIGKSAKSIYVKMMTPFVVRTQPKGITSAKFGSKTDIICDVSSNFPMRVRWFFKSSAGVFEVLTSGNHKISAAGTTLTILNTNMDAVGTYSCEASLVNDDEHKVAFTTNVLIDNLTLPVLLNTLPKVITVNHNQKVIIPCTIVAGVPPPDVTWHFMKKGETSFTKLPASGQELVIDGVALVDAGVYQCTATNVMGQANQKTELVVETEPDVFLYEGKTATVPYNSEKEFTCKAVGFPLPNIVWKDSKSNNLSVKINKNDINNEVISRLKLNNIKSSDTYSCFATNNLGQKTSSVKVHVLPSIDFAMFPPETISVKYEEPTVINCDARSSMPMMIKWFYQKDEHSMQSEIFTSEHYIISSDKRILRIVSTLMSDIGKYTCEASLINDEKERKSYITTVEINNLKVPEITYSNNTITIEKGENMSASCIADGIPKPNITWQFKSKPSDKLTSLPDEGERISISEMGYEDAGLYRCTATNALGTQSRNIDVVVDGMPKIINSENVYFGVTGDKVLKIPCEVEGFPTPAIRWKNRGKVVISDEKLLVGVNALYIKNPTEKDLNNFTCEAKNKYGYDEKNFEAEISDFITYNEEYNSNIYLKLDESTDIKCMLPHSDPQSIRWYVNGEKAEVLGTFYSIKNAQYSNDGNYTCRLNTEEGSESLNYVVDVGYKPSFKAVVPTNIEWSGNKEDTLDCAVYAKPNAKVEWSYNGKPVDVKWPELAVFGWGQYSCRASNVHDSVQRTFNVSSSDCLINRTAINVNNIPLLVDDKENTWPVFATTHEFYTLSPDESITLECATLDQPNNTFQSLPSVKRINATCYKENKFTVEGKVYKFNDLQCKAQVRPSEVITDTTCMDNGQVIEVGFKLAQGFLKAFEVCYSKVDRNTIYSKELMLAVNNGNIVTPSFKSRGTKRGDYGEFKKCVYSLRWLVHPENVAFGPAQTATLSDQYNTVQVFEPCEDSSRMSWNAVENAVKATLYSYDEITVWTGASQRDSNGIPRFLWKVVKFDDDTFETIVYVNAANPSNRDILCPDTESDTFSDVTSADDQYTFVCSMDNFLRAFKVQLTDFTTTS